MKILTFLLSLYWSLPPMLLSQHNDYQKPTARFSGQQPPGMTPVKFVPEIFSAIPHPHSALAFSPDSRELFWSALINGGPDQRLYCSTYDGNIFSTPNLAAFTLDVYAGGPAFSTDGKKLFFNAKLQSPDNPDKTIHAIWFVTRTNKGWSKPIAVASTLDTLMTKGQVTISRNGNIYFSGRILTERSPNIYCIKLVNGKYLQPKQLGGSINDHGVMVDPFVDPDERFILFTSMAKNASHPPGDIFLSYRQGDDTWGTPIRLADNINSANIERFASISIDGKYLFFVRSIGTSGFPGDTVDYFWMDAKIIEKSKTKEP